MEKIGRRKSTALSLFVGGICCLISCALVEHQNSAAKVIMTITFLLGKLGVTWTFGNIYIYTSGKVSKFLGAGHTVAEKVVDTPIT